jgi:hypothetical protein
MPTSLPAAMTQDPVLDGNHGRHPLAVFDGIAHPLAQFFAHLLGHFNQIVHLHLLAVADKAGLVFVNIDFIGQIPKANRAPVAAS